LKIPRIRSSWAEAKPENKIDSTSVANGDPKPAGNQILVPLITTAVTIELRKTPPKLVPSESEYSSKVQSLGALHSVSGLAFWFMDCGGVVRLVSGAGVLHYRVVYCFYLPSIT